MRKNYVDKSYMNTQFRFGYFHRLALRKVKNYSLTTFFNIHWSLNKNKNVKIQGTRNLRMNTKCREQAYYGNPQSLFILFDVCGRESSVLHFTPSFLFCFFKYCFLNKVIEIICSLYLLYFFPKFLMTACYIL